LNSDFIKKPKLYEEGHGEFSHLEIAVIVTPLMSFNLKWLIEIILAKLPPSGIV
jgi:hypothetical protein